MQMDLFYAGKHGNNNYIVRKTPEGVWGDECPCLCCGA
jgi:hypothetical protein